MGGCMDREMDRCTDGWRDAWMGGEMDGRINSVEQMGKVTALAT